jgi:hypothetical protein
MKDEMGPEFDEVDWKKLDPRQYDPRRIIREALLDDSPAPAAIRPVEKTEPASPVSDSDSPKQDQAEAGVAAMKLAAGSVEDASAEAAVSSVSDAEPLTVAAGSAEAAEAPVAVAAGSRTSPYDSEAT